MHVLTYLFCADSFLNAYIELMVKYASRTSVNIGRKILKRKKKYLDNVKI